MSFSVQALSLCDGTGGGVEDVDEEEEEEEEAGIRKGRAPDGEAWLFDGMVQKETLRKLR